MRKICLTVVGLFIGLLHAFSQSSTDTSGDYKNLNLKLNEVNLISGYYAQTGNHSAVTGGQGTQQLNDVSNVVQLKFVRWDIFDKKHTMDVEIGVDHHTAASSAYVSKTGASRKGGTRIYPSINWKTEDESKRSSFTWGLAFSSEYNYHSYSLNMGFSKTSKDQNLEFNAHAQVFLDRVKLIYPSELVPTTTRTPTTYTTASGRSVGGFFGGGDDGVPASARNTYFSSFSLSQVINKNLQVAVITDAVAQTGYLGLPFHRVYFTDGSVHVENLPNQRVKLPVATRISYFAGDKLVIRGYYRYYQDNWGVKAHTASLELPLKLTSFISVSPFYRYYTQTASHYFQPYMAHTAADRYYTSNYDYSAFQSNYYGVNVRLSPPKGVFGIQHFNLLEIRAGHYTQTTGLEAYNAGINLRFK